MLFFLILTFLIKPPPNHIAPCNADYSKVQRYQYVLTGAAVYAQQWEYHKQDTSEITYPTAMFVKLSMNDCFRVCIIIYLSQNVLIQASRTLHIVYQLQYNAALPWQHEAR